MPTLWYKNSWDLYNILSGEVNADGDIVNNTEDAQRHIVNTQVVDDICVNTDVTVTYNSSQIVVDIVVSPYEDETQNDIITTPEDPTYTQVDDTVVVNEISTPITVEEGNQYAIGTIINIQT